MMSKLYKATLSCWVLSAAPKLKRMAKLPYTPVEKLRTLFEELKFKGQTIIFLERGIKNCPLQTFFFSFMLA